MICAEVEEEVKKLMSDETEQPVVETTTERHLVYIEQFLPPFPALPFLNPISPPFPFPPSHPLRSKPPLPMVLGKYCNLPERGLGQSFSRNSIWCI